MELIIEAIIAVLVISVQVDFFTKTRVKIRALGSFFPEGEWDEAFIVPEPIGNKTIQLIDEEEFYGPFKDMLASINRFLRKNRGSAEFTIIRGIVERRIEILENEVASTITLPLYTGLMGTFAGIISGLVTIAFGSGKMEDHIDDLLGGVVIAMAASLFGLLLTVINNSRNFKIAKGSCDRNKTYFFDFLQEDLMPHMGNSLFEALDDLKVNINSFNVTFHENVLLFDTGFTENIRSLKDSVGTLSGTMQALVENTRTQQEFVQEIKRLGQLNMAKTNAEIFKLLNTLMPQLVAFQEHQAQLNDTVVSAGEAAGSIGRIMDRLQSFEKSLQGLGEVIDNRKFLGNEILTRVDKNLQNLDRDYQLLKEHELSSADQLNAYFTGQFQQIKQLTDHIRTEVEEALNVKIEDNPLQKLLLLESVEKHLKAIDEKLHELPPPPPVTHILESVDKRLRAIDEKLDRPRPAQPEISTPRPERRNGIRQRPEEEIAKPPEKIKRNWFKRLFRIK